MKSSTRARTIITIQNLEIALVARAQPSPILQSSRSAMGTPMSLNVYQTTTSKSDPFSFSVFCLPHSSCTSLLWCCSRVGCSCAMPRRQRSMRLLPPGRVLGCTTPSPPPDDISGHSRCVSLHYHLSSLSKSHGRVYPSSLRFYRAHQNPLSPRRIHSSGPRRRRLLERA